MVNWRYLTTIQGLVGKAACAFGDDLYIAGEWGLADTYAPRDAYAPIVRVSRDGNVGACCEWPAEGFAFELSRYEGTGLDLLTGLAAWQGQLWFSGYRYIVGGAGNSRFMSFDGRSWTVHAERACNELVDGGDRLVCGHSAGVSVYDGVDFEAILSHGDLGTMQRSLRVLPDGSVVGFSRDPAIGQNLNTTCLQRVGTSWQATTAPYWHHYSGDFTAYMGGSHIESWLGRAWTVEAARADSGALSYFLSFLVPGDSEWQRVLRINRNRPYPVKRVRNRLYLYEGSEDYITDIYDFMPDSESLLAAEFDGRSMEVYYPEEVVPYLVVPIGDGGAVAFCRSLARRAWVRRLLEETLDTAGAGNWTGWWHPYEPDADTLVYVTWPRLPGPPIVPHGDVEGTVTDTTPAALEGAAVVLEQLADTTDAAGDYAIDTVAIGRHAVGAAKAGYQSQVAEVSVEDGETTVQDFALPALTSGKGMIWGFVRDGLTGGGLYGATVQFAEGLTEQTAAGGYYAKELDPGAYDLTATLAGYVFSAGAVHEVLAEGETVRVDLFMYPTGGETPSAGDLVGTVRDLTTGEALAGVLVDLGDYEAATDGGGCYERRGIAAGDYAVSLTKTGYVGVSGAAVQIVAGKTTRADFGMVPTGTLVGGLRVVVTAGAAPVAGARVEVVDCAVATTAADGTATVGNLPAATYVVVVTAEGYQAAAATGTVTAGTTTDVEVDLTAVTEGAGYLWGLVRDVATRNPISGASVVAGGETSTTGAAGLYLIDDLPAGQTTAVASATDYHTQTIEGVCVAAEAGTRLDIGLVPTTVPVGELLTIGGYVVDAHDNAGVPGACVWLDGLATCYADELGRYQFPQVVAGSHELEASATGFYATHVGNVPAGAEVDIPLWRVARLGALVVAVVDAEGAVVEGATVAATADLQKTTGADGTATFPYLPEGWYRLVAYKDGYVPGTAIAQVGAEATASATVTIVAQEPEETDGYLVGYVVDQWTRAGVAGATVATPASTTSGPGGWYSLALAAAVYDVTAIADDYVPRTVEDVAVAARACTWLTIPLLPGTGVVVDEELLVCTPPVPDEAPTTVLVDYEEHDEDAEWELAVSAHGETRFRRAQRVARGVETTIEQPGIDLRVLARKVSGKISGVGVGWG